MQTPVQTVLAVDDRSAVGEARRIAARLAEKLGFTGPAAGALAVVVTEAATNVVKHAGRGELIFGAVQRGATSGIELLALDRGPGFANPARALRDGHSTAGSPGTGLGAIQRMASEFDMHSVPGKGMALRLVVWSRVPVTADDETRIGSVCLPKSGELACGDAWTAIRARHGHVLCMVDGLGHGADAAAAARTAIAAVADCAVRGAAAGQTIETLHLALRHTRGAAAAVALLHADEAMCTFCGVGNISACIITDGVSRSMVSYNGILGHQTRKIQEFKYPFAEGALCVLHSDGVATRWRLDDYPGLERSHPGLVAGVLYRDYSRRRDDTAVLAVRRSGRE